MTQPQALPFFERQQNLAEQLIGFWAEDDWPMNKCPLLPENTKRRSRNYHFKCNSRGLNLELKYAVMTKFRKGEWNPANNKIPQEMNRIIPWLNESHPQTHSLLERSLNYWQMSLRTYLEKRGTWHGRTDLYLTKSQTISAYSRPDGICYVFNPIYKVLEKTYDEREEHEKEIWDSEALGFERSTSTKLNFMRISQQWLRQAAQKYIRQSLATNEISTCLTLLTTINHFSCFLEDCHPTLPPSFLTREIIEEFMAYLQRLRLSDTSRGQHLYNLRQFIESCVRWGWAPLPERTLIYREDIPAPTKPAPRYLPDEIVDRLLSSLGDPEVPREYERMVRIDLHTGMRVGDLLTLKKDCLVQDSEGDYWITFYISKIKRDHSLPIDREMAKMIREQQGDVTRLFGDKVSVLFPNSRGQSRGRTSLSRAINKIVVRNNIRHLDGSAYRFEFHPLRHTCGTRMINSGYAHKVVQDWLGHDSPVMTDRYAKLFDKTKKEAFQKYQLSRGPLINIKAKVVSLDSPVDGVEHQVLKDQIKDRRLSLHNGHCTFPIPLGICPKFNACYQCAHFVTEKKFLAVHENDLREVELSLGKAQQNGWQRRVEKLEEDRKSLRRMIAKLTEEGLDGDGDEEA